jgi:HSP20 family protein
MADNSRTQPSENRSVARRTDALHPFPAFRRDMERLFEDFFSVFGMPGRGNGQQPAMPGAVMAPRMDVSETENEIRITADLPGVSEKDVEIRLIDDVLTISGETRIERDEQKEDFHLVERARGAFARSLRLPFRVDAKDVRANFQDGVLTITIPKPQEARERVQRIEVGRDQAGAGGEQSAVSGSQTPQAGGSQSSAEQRQPETAAG